MKKIMLSFLLLFVISFLLVGCNEQNAGTSDIRFKSTNVYAMVSEVNDSTINVIVGSYNRKNPMNNPGEGMGGNPPEDNMGDFPMNENSSGLPLPSGGRNPEFNPSENQNDNINFTSYNISIDIIVTNDIELYLENDENTTLSLDELNLKEKDILNIAFDENGKPTKIVKINSDFGPINQNYSHGSNIIISEDELKTTIREDYDVNESTQGKAENGTYLNLFNTTNIEKVYIDIDENNWNYLLQNAIDKPTVLADSITINNQTVEYVGIKTKGNLTLRSVWSSNSDRFSFTINFGKYIKAKKGYSENQNFYGISKIAFNDIYGDATLMKEYLSYCLMTEMGVDTPAYSLVDLYINNQFWGVYLMLESTDAALTQRTIGEKSDFLVKPESMGGDLLYDSKLDAYYDETTDSFNFDSLVYDDDHNIIYPKDQSNPLYAYCGLWENDEDTFEEVVDMLSTVFKWIKDINELSNMTDYESEEYLTKVSQIVDVDKLIRYFAVNTYLVNLDSYQSNMMQNYMLYINNSGKANIMPWDYNFSFGAFGVKSASEMVNFDIDNPIINTSLEDRPLLNFILSNPTYKALYYQYLEDCCIVTGGGTTSDGKNYAIDNFINIIDEFEKLLVVEYAEDPTAFYTVEQYKTAITNLKTLIKDRNVAVLQQVKGDKSIVSTNANLNAMGNSTGR